ncbi:hypothetical protein HanRHA438_Chr12g0532561 [Helianthus annuus]|nr:hypothetical protein HanRHA438_Chr12g0532561 [Helianthus annuus]
MKIMKMMLVNMKMRVVNMRKNRRKRSGCLHRKRWNILNWYLGFDFWRFLMEVEVVMVVKGGGDGGYIYS